jgi:thiol-disulfide isomerase/thioredoxin
MAETDGTAEQAAEEKAARVTSWWPAGLGDWLLGALRFVLLLVVITTVVGRLRAPVQFGAAPPFELVDLEGQTVSLKSLRGRPVVLNFWATWCGPCRAEMPMLAAWARSHPDAVVLGISVDRDPEAVRRLVPTLDVPYRILLDSRHEVATAYGVDTYPTTFRLDENGQILGSHTGVVFGPQIDLMDWW